MNYSLNDDLTREQFEELRQSGSINPAATYSDYLALKQERAASRREAIANGLRVCDAPELTEEDETIFAQMQASARERDAQPETLAA